jgi:transglutaminase-like putative cysteine protease
MFLPEGLRMKAAAYTAGARGHGPIAELAAATAGEAEGEVVPFATKLALRIHELCASVLREEGDPLPAEETLGRRSGSCRDLAVLFVAACREQGVPARFVTGYHESGGPQAKNYLHAWAEVYLPGGGWRGFDPSRGLAVADEHVPLAAAADFRGAAPISGTIRGGPVTLTMRADIEIRAMRSMAQ